MGTKKSNKLYAAAAALAVTASAVAPGLTADAASKVTVKSVTNPASISHYGGYTFAVKKLSLPKTVKVLLSNKKYENRSVKWGKVSYDKKYIGKYQTISGTVSGTTKKASIKVKLNNYPVDVVEPKLAPVAVGEKLNLPSTIDVKYKDGKVIARSAKSFNLTAEKTDKAGMMKLSYNYMGKNSSIKGSIAYEVKAAEITNVMNEIKDDMLSVSADVKYPAKDAKAEVLVYAFKDMTKEPIKVAAELKDGKLTAKSAVLPAGTHAFAVKVGEVVSPAKDFVIEAPMVKEVKAINAKEVTVTFNKAVDATTVLNGSNEVQHISFTGVGTASNPGTVTGKLSTDGKTLTISTPNTFNGSYAVATTEDIKTVSGAKVDKFEKVVSLVDEVRPTVSSPEYLANGKATFTFSEPINVADSAALANTIKLTDASGASFTPVVTLAADKKSFVLDLTSNTFTLGKSYSVAISSLVDYAGNLMTPNPAMFTVVKKSVDEVAPTVESISSKQAGYVVVNFSEKVAVGAGNVVATVGGVTADLDTNASLDESGRVLTVRDSSFNGIKDIAVSAFYDVAGNLGTAKTSLVNFPVDTVKPTVASKEVKIIDNQLYLVVTFSEDVTVQNATPTITGSYITDSGVEKTVNLSTTASAVTGSKNQVKILINTQEKGKYNVSLPADLVRDVVANPNEVAAVNYTVGTSASETVKPTVISGTQSSNNNEITVVFSEEVGASALDVNNYLIEGSVVAEKAVFTSDAKTAVKLTLKEGAIKKSGTYNFTVKNVADLAGNVLETVTSQKAFVENDKPALTSAVLTSNSVGIPGSATITLTFDEAINALSVDEAVDVADFGIFFDDASIAGLNVTETMGSSTNQVVLTLDRSLTAVEAAKTITLKPTAAFDVADLAGNLHPTFTSVTVTK
ncbi:Ig-like domain-containing protein [Exiguobacterium sp. OS-77]|uniref:Ig-like domain-containing protein n=1 Tax=Exiguobacterium sp. OS-77 TaxID=1241306 RepID=UPI00041C6467|nr:Ig-like domain-containing protein [Exiguobacterium sp. OS-77]